MKYFIFVTIYGYTDSRNSFDSELDVENYPVLNFEETADKENAFHYFVANNENLKILGL